MMSILNKITCVSVCLLLVTSFLTSNLSYTSEEKHDALASVIFQSEKMDGMRGAMWGQLIGDASALGSHWIYDQETIKQQFPNGLQGFETPSQGHYHFGKTGGDSTHYGEGNRLMLQSIAEKGKFDSVDFLNRFHAFFGSPLYTGYLDHATRQVLENLQLHMNPAGADDDQEAVASRLSPLVMLYHNDPQLLAIVEEATAITQNNPIAIAYMQCNAEILVDLLQGMDLRIAFEKHLDNPICGPRIQTALDLLESDMDFIESTKQLGLACPLDQGFASSVYLILRAEGSFEQTLLMNLQAGGDSAGRGALLGGWLGAHQGMTGIPQQWIMKLRGKEMINYWIEKLVMDAAKKNNCCNNIPEF